MTSTKKTRLLTGTRPTGKLHLGHYIGTYKNRLQLQDQYECFFLIADLHVLTTRSTREDVREIPQNIRDLVLDELALGIDPEKSTTYVQSAVKEIYQLNLIFEMLVTVSRLSRLPSIKEMARNAPYGGGNHPLWAAGLSGAAGGRYPAAAG
ncbi:MAG: hypothetical protein KatS3mg057_1852 [Herpetosiphonaceae bacterium]|nr:MAG: hypothetical protein KatS3mg057_1852 [Herpetosiphonaceae bacterium]